MENVDIIKVHTNLPAMTYKRTHKLFTMEIAASIDLSLPSFFDYMIEYARLKNVCKYDHTGELGHVVT